MYISSVWDSEKASAMRRSSGSVLTLTEEINGNTFRKLSEMIYIGDKMQMTGIEHNSLLYTT